MRNVVVEDARAAVQGLKDGHTVMVGGFGNAGLPLAILKAVVEAGVRDLTLISNNAGTVEDDLTLWFRAKIVRKIICSYPRGAKAFTELYRKGEVELELVPQGTLVERIRAGGAGMGGFPSPVGVGTDFAKGKQVLHVGGRDYILELPLKADFTFVKGKLADTVGNVTYNMTARNHCPAMATAAETTVVEVDRIVAAGELDPEAIVTPCIFVDRVFARAKA
ncbi:MAG: 3-oxoacid CoA-transferase subunit A [Hyphomicrobiales bacterium]|nr:MAG: 3-oxoacid CoA-transferase subunit A [Hyphomicrobiales bacterium]